MPLAFTLGGLLLMHCQSESEGCFVRHLAMLFTYTLLAHEPECWWASMGRGGTAWDTVIFTQGLHSCLKYVSILSALNWMTSF